MNPNPNHHTCRTEEQFDSVRMGSVEGWAAVTVALVLTALFLPLMGLIALIILWTDGRPVLYRGTRLGQNQRPFTMFKFRTLRVGAEAVIGGRLMHENDDLTTPIGRILRRLKLDELPQLFNILNGDMTFVGPRPVRIALAIDYASRVRHYYDRFNVRPGLTGLAQLRGGYYCEPARKTRYDLFYIRKRSLALDLKLLGLTALRMIISPDCLKSGDRPPARTAAKSKQPAVNGTEMAA